MTQFLMAQVTVEGSRPMLWHAFGPDALGDGSGKRKEREGTAGNDPGEWRKTVLFVPETRQLYVKPSYIFGCLRDGAKHTPRKRGSAQGPLASTLQVLDDIILIDRYLPEEPLPTDPTELVYLDICGVKNPATRGRNVRYRVGSSTGWHCTFNIMWDSTIISRNEMESILTDAGKLCGLGDGRSIGYGRFIVQSYEVRDAKDAPTA